jgi:hypothetical protein
VLEARAAELEYADHVRAQWYAHTAETRSAADRSAAELSARIAAGERQDELISAEEWLAENRGADLAEDPHRQVTHESDLVEVAAQREADLLSLDGHPPPADAVGLDEDIRQVTAAEPVQLDEDKVRVPSADETADAVARAQRALAELERRRAEEQRRAAEETRATELARWHCDDQTVERARAVDRSHPQAPAVDRSDPRVPGLAITTPLD